MSEPRHSGSLLHRVTFWLVSAQLGYSIWIHTQKLFYIQKGWPVAVVYTPVVRILEALKEHATFSMGTQQMIWHGLALVQAFVVGFCIDGLRRVLGSGITRGN